VSAGPALALQDQFLPQKKLPLGPHRGRATGGGAHGASERGAHGTNAFGLVNFPSALPLPARIAVARAFQVTRIKVECCRDERFVKARRVNPKNFFAELKRRNVYKVAVAYAIVGWLVMQIAATVVPALHLSDAITSAVVLLVILGFPIALIIAWAFELTPEGLKRTEFADESPKKTARSRAWIYVVIVAGTISVSLFFLARYTSPKQSGNVELPAKSIAVLPFVNMSSDRENEYFVDGLTEEILNRVAQINELKVPGRTSCFAFKDKNADLRQVGASLGVAHVLEGSVRKSGERLRITVQLVRTHDGYHLWSQSFDRKLDDVFAIQEEIARSIAEALSVQLKVASVGQAEPPTQDMRAYDDYLKARTLITQRSPTNVRSAIPLLEAAVQRDSAFAKAWAALAQAYAFASYYLPIDTIESLQNAENAARKALALDASLAAAHSALADVLRDRYHWSEAEAEYHRALELSPGEAETHHQYAQMLLSVGHTDSALEHAKRACELDPLAWVPSATRALVHLCRGEFAEGKDSADRSAKIRGHVGGFQTELTLLYALASKDVDLARRAIAQAGQVEWSLPPDTKVLKLTDEALAALIDHSRSPPDLANAPREVQGFVSNGNLFLAAVAAFVGQKEAALQALSAGLPSRALLPELGLIWSPVFKPLRNEPRFLELVRAMKLPDYWRVAGWGDYCRAKRGDDFECIGP
jgi:TolB-like protein